LKWRVSQRPGGGLRLFVRSCRVMLNKSVEVNHKRNKHYCTLIKLTRFEISVPIWMLGIVVSVCKRELHSCILKQQLRIAHGQDPGGSHLAQTNHSNHEVAPAHKIERAPTEASPLATTFITPTLNCGRQPRQTYLVL
jgi:hypothetical protein